MFTNYIDYDKIVKQMEEYMIKFITSDKFYLPIIYITIGIIIYYIIYYTIMKVHKINSNVGNKINSK